MKVIRCGSDEVISDKEKKHNNIKTAIALGNLDGVHIGHAKLINEITARSDMYSCVYTFRRHPQNIMNNTANVKILTDNSQKSAILGQMGVDYVCFDDFEDVRDLSPARFIDEVLIDKLNCGFAVCGFNYRFGKMGAGDAEFLKQYLGEKGIECKIIPSITYDGAVVSSTRIRFLLENGNPELAATLLGRPYYIRLPVIHGMRLGRTIGIPTINQQILDYMVHPQNGVYACVCRIDGEDRIAVCDVGYKPTVGGKELLAETHIIGFNSFVYGKTAEVHFYKKIRDEIKFSDMQSLKNAIEIDIENTKKYFKILENG